MHFTNYSECLIQADRYFIPKTYKTAFKLKPAWFVLDLVGQPECCISHAALTIPLIGKDGDDVINNITCSLTGTESVCVHRVYTGNVASNRIKQLKSSTKLHCLYKLTPLNPHDDLNRIVRKPTFCICEKKDADQLRGYHEADQRLCFRYFDSTIPLLPTNKISSL